MNTPIRAAVVALAVLVAACGSDDDAAQTDTSTTTTEPPASVTSSTSSSTVAVEAPVVLVTGDSMAFEIAPGVEAALDPEVAEVDWLLTPILGTEPNQSHLLRRIADDGVDVAIVVVGVWERTYESDAGLELADEGFEESYAAEVLDPLRDALVATGGRLLLAGPPALRVAADQAEVEELERIWSAYADGHDRVDFADTDDWLGDGGVYLGDDDGVALRNSDTIHLCDEGAIRIVAGILDELAPELGGRPAIDPAWRDGSWRDEFTDEACPDL